MKEIKACPFCGKSVALVMSDAEMGYDNNGQFIVVCPFYEDEDVDSGCGASSPWKYSQEEAVEAWNRRTQSRNRYGK